MADPLYTRLAATANRLIAQYGKAAVITRNVASGPAHDPVLTPTDYNVTLVETEDAITKRQQALTKTGDKTGIVSTDGDTNPELNDQIDIDGDLFNLIDLEPLNPGGLLVLTSFVARS